VERLERAGSEGSDAFFAAEVQRFLCCCESSRSLPCRLSHGHVAAAKLFGIEEVSAVRTSHFSEADTSGILGHLRAVRSAYALWVWSRPFSSEVVLALVEAVHGAHFDAVHGFAANSLTT
jgi:hypothetical protein